jgi:hypothetical protein
MKYIFIILSGLYTFGLLAQEVEDASKLNSFQIDFGVNQVKEENLHPKVHTGVLYGLSYEQTKQSRQISNFKIGVRYSRLKTKFEELSATANIQLSGKYNFVVETIKRERLNYFTGPEIELHYNLSYYPNWDESHLYWGSCLNIGVKNKLNYTINDKQSLVLDLSLSFFSVFSRPVLDRQYKIDDISFGGIIKDLHSKLEGGTINKSFSTFFQTEYQFHTSEKITQAICYSYDYRRLKSKDGRSFQNSIHVIGFKIYF